MKPWNKGKYLIDLPKGEIITMYIKERMSLAEIAKKYSCATRTVNARLMDWKIPRRPTGPRLKKICRVPKEDWKLAYLASAIDCDGSVFLGKNSDSRHGLRPQIAVNNTEIKIMDWLEKEIGGNANLVNKGPKTWKPCYRWSIGSILDVYSLLTAIIPFMTIKQDRAIKVLEACEQRMKERNIDR